MEPARGRRDATDPEPNEGGNSQMTDPTRMDPSEPIEAAAPEPATAPAAAPAPPAAPPAAAPAAAPAPAAPTAPAPAAAAAGAARPTGITILAVLAGIGGVLGLFSGFLVLFAGTVLFGAFGALFGLAALAYAGLLIAFAYGAWKLLPWAWPLGVAVAAFGIILAVLYVIGGAGIGNQILGVAVDAGILYYLNQPGIKSLFGRA